MMVLIIFDSIPKIIQNIENYQKQIKFIFITESKMFTLNNFQRIVLCIAVLLILISLALNVAFRRQLFLMGVNFIYDFQTSSANSFLTVIMNLFSITCHPIGVVVVLISYYIISKRKLLTFVYLSYVAITTFIITIFKQGFQQTRPFWYSKEVSNLQWFCPKDFGNPSGHSFAVFLVYEPILTDSLGFGKYKIGWIFLIIFGVAVPLSRMYLGVHSADQIVLGLFTGLLFTVLYRYVYQKMLYSYFWMLISETPNILVIVLTVLSELIVYTIAVIFYILNGQNRPMEIQDLTNLNQKCSLTMTSQQNQMKAMILASMIHFVYGIIYGLMLLEWHEYKLYMTGWWQYISYTKILVYSLLCMLVIAPVIGVLAITTLVIKQAYIKYTLLSIGLVLSGIALSYGFSKLIKWGEFINERMHNEKLPDDNRLVYA